MESRNFSIYTTTGLHQRSSWVKLPTQKKNWGMIQIQRRQRRKWKALCIFHSKPESLEHQWEKDTLYIIMNALHLASAPPDDNCPSGHLSDCIFFSMDSKIWLNRIWESEWGGSGIRGPQWQWLKMGMESTGEKGICAVGESSTRDFTDLIYIPPKVERASKWFE